MNVQEIIDNLEIGDKIFVVQNMNGVKEKMKYGSVHIWPECISYIQV